MGGRGGGRLHRNKIEKGGGWKGRGVKEGKRRGRMKGEGKAGKEGISGQGEPPGPAFPAEGKRASMRL